MATIHLRIQKETLEKDESVLHLMPCKIHGDAPAKISSYFSPYIRRVDDEHLDASFRGRPLNGTNVTVPKGYRGLTFYEHKRPDPDATERNLYSTGNFSRFTYWNYDKIPSRNDAFAAALDWIDIAEAGRIKKIMQTDEEVGKVAQAVPIIITLELFVHSLLTKTMQITSAKNAKTLSPSHMKQCILSESRFDFLKDLVKGLPDVAGPDEETPTPPPTPAAVTTDARPAIVCPSTPHRSPRRTEVESAGRKSSPESGGGASDVASALPSPPHVPEFQISVPTSFRVGQPNFYTEVNPAALTTSPTDMSVTTPPTSNFDNTANIDEDYDT